MTCDLTPTGNAQQRLDRTLIGVVSGFVPVERLAGMFDVERRLGLRIEASHQFVERRAFRDDQDQFNHRPHPPRTFG